MRWFEGSTIRPLVKLLNVERRDDREVTMSESVFIKYIHYTMSGLEDISGQKGHYSLLDTYLVIKNLHSNCRQRKVGVRTQ